MKEEFREERERAEVPDIEEIFAGDSKSREETVAELCKIIMDCRKKPGQIRGKIGKVTFFGNKENAQSIDFASEDGNFLVTIEGENISSEVEFNKTVLAFYVDREDKNNPNNNVTVRLRRGITIINCEEISESYDIASFDDVNGSKTQAIIKDIEEKVPEYEQVDSEKVQRTGIKQEETINRDLRKVFDSPIFLEENERTSLPLEFVLLGETSPDAFKTYGGYIEPAKLIESKCKELYALIIEACKAVEEHDRDNKEGLNRTKREAELRALVEENKDVTKKLQKFQEGRKEFDK